MRSEIFLREGEVLLNRPAHCEKCQRVLFAREHDHCMWCGAPLSEALRLSDAEKATIAEQRQREQAVRRERERREREWHELGRRGRKAARASGRTLLDFLGDVGGDVAGNGDRDKENPVSHRL